MEFWQAFLVGLVTVVFIVFLAVILLSLVYKIKDFLEARLSYRAMDILMNAFFIVVLLLAAFVFAIQYQNS